MGISFKLSSFHVIWSKYVGQYVEILNLTLIIPHYGLTALDLLPRD